MSQIFPYMFYRLFSATFFFRSEDLLLKANDGFFHTAPDAATCDIPLLQAVYTYYMRLSAAF